MDFHTHNLHAPAHEAIINLPEDALLCPASFTFQAGRLYSAGIHPWWTARADVYALFEGLQQLLRHPAVVAVGECGIDRLRGADEAVQEQWFVRQVQLAEAADLPVTVHCVKAFDVLLRLHKELRPTTRWTIHGFRGKPALAAQLLATGFDLSFGRHFNAESYEMTPPERRHRESDEDY